MSTSAAVGDASLADVDSIDTPTRVTPSPAAAAKQISKTPRPSSGDDMEDIFGSQTSLTDSAKRRSPAANDLRRGHESGPTGTVREDGANSSTITTTSIHLSTSRPAVTSRTRVPSKENLYGRRSSSSNNSKRAATQPTAVRHVTTVAPSSSANHPSTSALAEQYGSQVVTERTVCQPSATSSSTLRTQRRRDGVAVDVECDAAPTTDTLLRRMRNKEREFDQKIHVIHNTFQNAGEQLVMRDCIIAQLQEELAQLRTEARRIPKEYQAREEQLLLRVDEMMQELREEQARAKSRRHAADEEARQLRVALDTADEQLKQQQRVSDDLLRQLRAADRSLRDEKEKHATALQQSRQTYEEKLMECQRAYNAVEKELVKVQARNEEAEKDRAESQARLLEHELDSRRQRSGDVAHAKELATENIALREEVEAAQLSTARLLRLLSEVPALVDYLQWNELSSEFVFLGYPTRYFASGNSIGRAPSHSRRVSPASRGISPRSTRRGSRQTSPVRRCATSGAAASSLLAEDRGVADHSAVHRNTASSSSARSAHATSYFHDVNVSNGSLVGTGVEDGVYAGIASSLSKNVWLNGRWAQQMMDIIAAENNFTRLKRIKLLELEEAAQLSEQLPSARDVLECRRQERDYWIPYAVFTEAQKFKNKYYPKLPAMSHFYPFLIQLNKIWCAKLHDRLRVRQQRLPATENLDPYSHGHRRSRDAAIRDRDGGSQMTSRGVTASQCDIGRSEELLSDLVQCEARADEIQAEHHRLRRDVRLRVSSQRALQLFRLYDEVLHSAHENLIAVLKLTEELYNSYQTSNHNHSSGRATSLANDAEARTRSAADTLRDAQLQAQMQADINTAEDARDQLLCVVKRTCERVCDIGDSLSTRMMSYYSDLHQLIQMLHQHVSRLRSQGGGGTGAEDASSSGSSSESEHRGGVAPTKTIKGREDAANVELSRKLRKALRERYEAAEVLVKSDASASALSGPDVVGIDSLLKLAASVLDFGNEVRKEVTDASGALHSLAEQAMHEAEQLGNDT